MTTRPCPSRVRGALRAAGTAVPLRSDPLAGTGTGRLPAPSSPLVKRRAPWRTAPSARCPPVAVGRRSLRCREHPTPRHRTPSARGPPAHHPSQLPVGAAPPSSILGPAAWVRRPPRPPSGSASAAGKGHRGAPLRRHRYGGPGRPRRGRQRCLHHRTLRPTCEGVAPCHHVLLHRRLPSAPRTTTRPRTLRRPPARRPRGPGDRPPGPADGNCASALL